MKSLGAQGACLVYTEAMVISVVLKSTTKAMTTTDQGKECVCVCVCVCHGAVLYMYTQPPNSFTHAESASINRMWSGAVVYTCIYIHTLIQRVICDPAQAFTQAGAAIRLEACMYV